MLTSDVPQILQDKVAFLLGASSGIGLASAAQLLKSGSHVVLASRNEDKLRRAAERLVMRLGITESLIDIVVCDAYEESQVEAAVKETACRKGRIDIAIAVAGSADAGPLLKMQTSEFERSIRWGTLPGFLLLKHCAPLLALTGAGSFVAISSITSILSAVHLGAYSAGKAALEALIRVAADELGPHGVRVNAIRPGSIRTPATDRSADSEGYLQTYLSEQALKRIGEPEDVGAAVRFLAGPESSWITGQCLNVDGGLSLHRIPKLTGSEMPDEWRAFLG